MSLLFADVDELYAIADRISRHADTVRSGSASLAAAVSTAAWRGVAADVFDAEARGVMTDMRACAARLDDAADALRRHAGNVHGMLDRLLGWWHDLEHTAGDVAHDVGDFVTGANDHLVDDLVARMLAEAGR